MNTGIFLAQRLVSGWLRKQLVRFLPSPKKATYKTIAQFSSCMFFTSFINVATANSFLLWKGKAAYEDKVIAVTITTTGKNEGYIIQDFLTGVVLPYMSINLTPDGNHFNITQLNGSHELYEISEVLFNVLCYLRSNKCCSLCNFQKFSFEKFHSN